MSRVAEWAAVVRDARSRELAARLRPGTRVALGREVRKLHQAQALLIAVHYAAASEVCDFDVGDALAAIVGVVGSSVARLDELEVRDARRSR